MEGVILVLCLLLTILLVGVLLSGIYRLCENYRKLQERMEEGNVFERTIIVKQAAGMMKISYYTEPKEQIRESIQEIIARESALAEARRVEASSVQEPFIIQNGILIQRSEKLTFQQKYKQLSEDNRKLLDDFTAYITGKADCDKLVQTNAMSFRYRKGLIAKSVIRRGIPILYFYIKNPELGRMVREEKLKSVKVQPVEVRLTGDEKLAFAKQTADITVGYLKSEEDYKLEKRKEARREAARLRRSNGEVGQ